MVTFSGADYTYGQQYIFNDILPNFYIYDTLVGTIYT